MREPYDIFISYSQEDGEIAAFLASRFDDAGLKCFLADKSILAATQWDTALREAIRNATHILVLLTPRSKNSLWVAAEIGAAWVLDKPLIPALQFVTPQDLLEPVRKYQTRTIETPPQIEALVREIAGLHIKEPRSYRGLEANHALPRGAFSGSGFHESFTSAPGWGQLLKVGEWRFDAVAKELIGEGMYRYVLSGHTYGPRPFTIDCRLTFLDLKPKSGLDAVNAGIVLGWSTQDVTPPITPRYLHLALSGKALFFEKVGFRGKNEYVDFQHIGQEVPFLLEVNVPYDFSVRVEAGRLRVSCNGREVFDVDVQPDEIVGRVGLRPWRSTLSCQRFEVRTGV